MQMCVCVCVYIKGGSQIQVVSKNMGCRAQDSRPFWCIYTCIQCIHTYISMEEDIYKTLH